MKWIQINLFKKSVGRHETFRYDDALMVIMMLVISIFSMMMSFTETVDG